jgi:hypothetical protein
VNICAKAINMTMMRAVKKGRATTHDVKDATDKDGRVNEKK